MKTCSMLIFRGVCLEVFPPESYSRKSPEGPVYLVEGQQFSSPQVCQKERIAFQPSESFFREHVKHPGVLRESSLIDVGMLRETPCLHKIHVFLTECHAWHWRVHEGPYCALKKRIYGGFQK